MNLTIKQLQLLDACTTAQNWFTEKFGRSGDIVKVLKAALKDGHHDWASWVLSNIVPVSEHEVFAEALYKNVVAPMLTEKKRKAVAAILERGTPYWENDNAADMARLETNKGGSKSAVWATWAAAYYVRMKYDQANGESHTYAYNTINYALYAEAYAISRKRDEINAYVGEGALALVKRYVRAEARKKAKRAAKKAAKKAAQSLVAQALADNVVTMQPIEQTA